MTSLGLDKCETLYLQDFIPTSQNPEPENKLDPSEAFFELANARQVGFRIENAKVGVEISGCVRDKACNDSTREIVVQQQSACRTHTGGIVWETSFLLSCFLLEKCTNKHPLSLGRVLEVGAG